MEVKHDGTAEDALQQIHAKDYAVPYAAKGKVVRIGIAFSRENHALSEWLVEGQ